MSPTSAFISMRKRPRHKEGLESPLFWRVYAYRAGGGWLEPSVLPNLFHIMTRVEKYTYVLST